MGGMKILKVRNVNGALSEGVRYLRKYGERRPSRGGDVLVVPWPMVTEYAQPTERVLFCPQRDANPFFHLAEAIWMLQGRRDLREMMKYVSTFSQFSDDGVTLHGAYGRRWRHTFGEDQLAVIARRLSATSEDRRSVLQMWDATRDLDRNGLDVPCNLVATFQVVYGRLDLTVFCRSNDIIWGAYGANAVHFSMLQEYMAAWIKVPVGVYRQISVNWHAYIDALDALPSPSTADPYQLGTVVPTTMFGDTGSSAIKEWDEESVRLSNNLDRGVRLSPSGHGWWGNAQRMLYAHSVYKSLRKPESFDAADSILRDGLEGNDWIVAAMDWIRRRKQAWHAKNQKEAQIV